MHAANEYQHRRQAESIARFRHVERNVRLVLIGAVIGFALAWSLL